MANIHGLGDNPGGGGGGYGGGGGNRQPMGMMPGGDQYPEFMRGLFR